MDFNMYMYHKTKEGYDTPIKLPICIFAWLCGKRSYCKHALQTFVLYEA